MKQQTLEAMKNNRLLEIAFRKTQRQNKLIKEFLARNNIKIGKPESPTNNKTKDAFITQQEKVNMDMSPSDNKQNLTKLLKLKSKKPNYIH